MKSEYKILLEKAATFFVFTGISIATTGIVFADIALINGVGEKTFVEAAQAILLLLTSALLLLLAKKNPQNRGTLTLLIGFYLCAFIRELDWLFDQTPIHWSIVTTLIATASLAYALQKKRRDATIIGLAKFTQHESFHLMSVGLVVTLILSRLLGSKHLWMRLFDDPLRLRTVKNAIEENLELFGYSLIFMSVVRMFISSSKINTESQNAEPK